MKNEYTKEKEILMVELEERIQDHQESLNRPGREENIRKSLKKVQQQIMKKDQDKTKPNTIRVKKETLEFLKTQESLYQRLINRILDSWVHITSIELKTLKDK